MIRYLMLIFVFLLVSPISIGATNRCPKDHCIAVIDAGSTGSRLHIYAYTLDQTQTPIEIEEVWLKRNKPGFATLEPSERVISGYLDNLVSDAPIQNIPVYFYATAGMRLLPNAKQKLYYNELRQWFEKHQNWNLIQAKTITGTDEAILDWISVNYHIGNLQASEIKPVGVMDMGGASVQIVFPIDTGMTVTAAPIRLKLYGKEIYLFAHSFLGLGQTEMSHQFLNSIPCFSENYPLPDGDSGHGDAQNCEHDISSLLNSVHGVNSLIAPILNQTYIQDWYSMGGISNLSENQLFNFENNEITNEDLLKQADSQICHQTWDNLNARFPSDEYLYQYCLLSSYYYALMVEGYGFDSQKPIHVISSKDNLDWTRGVVLYRSL